ncbi:MAG: thioredoxin domain-containing protein [bacterium]|nr:thioredoxin domain-containing protein [bacterium]
MDEGQKSNAGLIVGIVVVAALIFGGLTWALIKAPSAGPRAEQVTFSDTSDASRGPLGAKVVVRMYSDFQCPACRVADRTMEQVINKYEDRVKFVWKDFPLEQIHPVARPAANAARCANDQGWFWKFSKQLFDNQDAWTVSADVAKTFGEYAVAVGADGTSFSACMAQKQFDSRVQTNIAEGTANNVDRTPTTFVNNQRYFSMSVEDWGKALDRALAEAN